MSEVKVVDTKKYIVSGNVLVDGKEWVVQLPGAGRELQYSKVARRIKVLNTKVENDTATEEDLDKLDSLEDFIVEYFVSIWKDTTEDNSEVRKWVNDTPMAVISAALEDIKKAADTQNAAITSN